METSIGLVGLVLLLLAVGPIFGVLLYNRHLESKLYKRLKDICSTRNYKISQSEFFKHRLLAIDEDKMVFIYLRRSKSGKIEEKQVDLTNMKESKLFIVRGFSGAESDYDYC